MEAQQDEAATRSASERPRLTREATDRLRQKESLQLALRNVLQQLECSQNDRHRTLLETARGDLERRIAALSP